MILGATYMLWMYQKVMFGPVTSEANQKMADLNAREIMTMIPIMILIFVMGIFPNLFLRKMDASVNYFIEQYHYKLEQSIAENSKPPVAAIAQKTGFATHNESKTVRQGNL